jgi:chitinase
MLMTYDYHELAHTSINAPLQRESNQPVSMETVADNVARVLDEGCSPEKVILGIPTYGRTYTLRNASKNDVGAAVEGAGDAGPYTLSNGSLGFNEVRQQAEATPSTRAWD